MLCRAKGDDEDVNLLRSPTDDFFSFRVCWAAADSGRQPDSFCCVGVRASCVRASILLGGWCMRITGYTRSTVRVLLGVSVLLGVDVMVAIENRAIGTRWWCGARVGAGVGRFVVHSRHGY